MFVILQKYDFSSKSQPLVPLAFAATGCLWYCKSTIFQANHNSRANRPRNAFDVCDTAKVRFFKQITTPFRAAAYQKMMFVILQKYDFSSKSQPPIMATDWSRGCLWYCKSTIFQANHNQTPCLHLRQNDVCDTAKVRFFKQITTNWKAYHQVGQMFVILQKYDFSSKSQRAIYNLFSPNDVCDTAKVRFFKQITTPFLRGLSHIGCLWYCKSTIFQANHNLFWRTNKIKSDVCDTAKVRFFKQITTLQCFRPYLGRCLWYCKSTIFQANHNPLNNALSTLLMFVILQKYDFSSKSQQYISCSNFISDVCDTAKVRFFKQITTHAMRS